MIRIKNCVISLVALLAYTTSSLADGINLSSDEAKRLVEQISADPNAAKAYLNAKLDSSKASAKRSKGSAVNSKPATSSAANPTSPKPDSTSPQPDAITALLSKNENKPPSQRQYSQCPGFNLLLRQNWADTGIIAGNQCPDTVDKATGAQISFTDDRVAHNQVALLNGTAALIYNSVTGDTPAQITPYEMSFGVFTTFDKSTNSALSQVKSNIDTLSYGGVFELGFSNPEGANYFQLRGANVEDGIKGTTAANASLEWLPVFNPLFIHVPYIQPLGLPLITRFDPALVVLYDAETGNKKGLAFNNRPDFAACWA